MGKLHTIGNVIIRLYANDHVPPHFHAIGPDHQALIEIDPITISRGGLPPSVRREVLSWAEAHRNDIVAEWNRINPRFPVTLGGDVGRTRYTHPGGHAFIGNIDRSCLG